VVGIGGTIFYAIRSSRRILAEMIYGGKVTIPNVLRWSISNISNIASIICGGGIIVEVKYSVLAR
jgi:hypothetical protein